LLIFHEIQLYHIKLYDIWDFENLIIYFVFLLLLAINIELLQLNNYCVHIILRIKKEHEEETKYFNSFYDKTQITLIIKEIT